MTATQQRLTRATFINGRCFGLRAPGMTRSLAVSPPGVPFVVRWSLLLFVATVPVEYLIMSWSFSLPQLSGLVFFGSYFFYYSFVSKKRSFPLIPAPMWWFVGYVAVFILGGFFVVDTSGYAADGYGYVDILKGTLTRAQLLVFFWLAADLIRDEKMARNVLLSYSAAAALLALGTVLHVPGFAVERTYGSGMMVTTRTSALGFTVNVFSAVLALAGVTLIGLLAHPVFSRPMRKALLVALTLPVLAALVETGSRSGLGGLLCGFLVYLLPSWKSRRGTFVAILGAAGLAFTIYLAITDASFSSRLGDVAEGRFAGREELTPTTIDMILERPVFGWNAEGLPELAVRLGYTSGGGRDTHNLFLHLMVEVGLVGTIPFLIGLWLCGQAAWRARRGDFGLLPLALLVTMLVTGMTHTDLLRKPTWLVLALCFTAAASRDRPQQRANFFAARPPQGHP